MLRRPRPSFSGGQPYIVFWEYDGFVVWDESKAIAFDKRFAHLERDGHYSVQVLLDRP